MRVQAEVYENIDACWMIKVSLSSVDSPHGLAAYFAVLLRNNGLVRSYRLTKVVEHWNISPGDGNVYYACAFRSPFKLFLACVQILIPCSCTGAV